MSRFSRTLSALVGATATFLAMAAMPTAAMADSDITLISAGATGGNPYLLSVEVGDAAGLILSSPDGTTPPMTIQLLDSGNNDVYNVTNMAYESGPAGDQIWTAASPIPQAALTPGSYTMSISASDSSPDTAVFTAPLTFAYNTAISAHNSPPSVTAGSQQVTFTGTVTGTPPGGSAVGLNGVPVEVSINGGTPQFAANTTDALGDFTYSPPVIAAPTSYAFSVAAGSNYSAASTGPIQVGTQAAATTVTAQSNLANVSQGATTVTFTGNVSAIPQGSSNSVPLANVPVNLNGALGNPIAFTDANGNFTYSASGLSSGGQFTFGVDGTDIYTTAQAQPIVIGVVAAPTVISVSPSISDITFGSQDVTFSGAVTVVPSGQTKPVSIGSGIQVYLNGGTNPVATTDANGDFTYSASGLSGLTNNFDFTVSGTPLYTGADGSVQIPLAQGHSEMTVTANPHDVNLESQTVTFTGHVVVMPAGSTSSPDGPNIPVYLNNGANPVATTDSNGNFSVTIHNITQAGDYSFSIPEVQTNLYSGATYDVPIGLDQLQSNMLVMPSQTTVTEGSQNVTFTGTFAGTPPGGGTTAPLTGAPVMLSVNGGPQTQVATTDDNGKFTYSAGDITQANDYNFIIASTSTYTSATDDVPIGISPAQTRITGITVTPARVRYGQTATLTGTVQYLGGGMWTALSNATVQVTEGSKSVATATTATAGGFSVSLPTTNGSAWSAVVSPGVLTQQAPAAGNLDIFVPLKVLSFAATLKVNGDLSAKGCLQVTAPVRYAPQTSVQIQYRAARHGAWRVLGRIQLHNSPKRYASCPGANESYFNDSLRARLANAYYRAYFPANANYTSAVSKSIHAWRYETRIVRFSVRPRSITSTTKATVTGRLQVHRDTWRPYAHQPIRLIYNVKGTNYWSSLGRPVITNSRGRFSYYPVEAQAGSGSFVAVIYAQYRGDKTHLACESPGVDVSVNGGQSSSALVHIAPDRFPTVALLPIVDLPVLTPGPPPLTGLLLKQEAA